MVVESTIKFLRESVQIQYEESEIQDPAYLSMTDDDLLLYLNTVKTRDFNDYSTLSQLPESSVYGLVLLAKKELYYTLAVKEAPLYDIGADGAYLKRSQRFDHYMKLAEDAEKDYKSWLESSEEYGFGTVKTYSTTVANRYATKYNKENSPLPQVMLGLSNLTKDSVELDWKVKNLGKFFRYKIYLSESPIVDEYNLSEKVSPEAKLIAEIKDIHQCKCRITNLTEGTKYYVAVQAMNLTYLSGYAEEEFETVTEAENDTDIIPEVPVSEESGG